MSITIPQTSVSTAPLSKPFPGVLADASYVKHTDSCVSAEASAEIPFGVAVVRDGTNKDTGVKLPHTSAAASAPLFRGVTVHSHSYARGSELGDNGLKPKVTVLVLQRGRIWVLPEEAVAPGDAVRFRVVAAGAEKAGAFRATADSTDCVDISKFARWVTSGNSTTPCQLEIDVNGAEDAAADA